MRNGMSLLQKQKVVFSKTYGLSYINLVRRYKIDEAVLDCF